MDQSDAAPSICAGASIIWPDYRNFAFLTHIWWAYVFRHIIRVRNYLASEVLTKFSFLSGCYALMIVITQDTMGDFKFSAAYGTLLFVEALGVVIGPPIAGWLKDRLGNYSSTLFVSGSLLIVSGKFVSAKFYYI